MPGTGAPESFDGMTVKKDKFLLKKFWFWYNLEIRNLRDQLIAIEQQREMMERDLHRAEEALDTERQAVQDLTMVIFKCVMYSAGLIN